MESRTVDGVDKGPRVMVGEAWEGSGRILGLPINVLGMLPARQSPSGR